MKVVLFGGGILSKQYPEYVQDEDFDIIIFSNTNTDSELGQAMFENVAVPSKLLQDLLPHQKMIHLSTSAVYSGLTGIVTEDSRLTWPLTSYELAHQLMSDVITFSKKPVVSLRLASMTIKKIQEEVIETGIVKRCRGNARRSILKRKDFFETVKTVVENFVPGIYNVSSFDTTSLEIEDALVKKYTCMSVYDEDAVVAYNFFVTNSVESRHQ